MQLTSQRFRPTKKYARLSRSVNLADGFEHRVPIWSAEIGGSSQSSDGILFRVGVVDHDIGGIVKEDLGSEILDGQVS